MISTYSFEKELLPHSDRLFRMALRITLDKEAAEDLVRETLLKVWQHHDTLSEIDNLESYLITICRRLALDYMARKERDNVSLDQVDIDTADASVSPLEKLSRDDRIAWVRQLIDTLPEKQRSIVQLRDIEDKSVKETAEILGITQEDVKTSHHRARKTLRAKLQEIDQYGL